ncbi:MAG TPA: MarR family transcriptional regulator [Clostridiaceae bacterium]|nr:MarR family transcriptional regulator [Clostridiaceae bacterium]
MSDSGNKMFPQPYFNDNIIHYLNDINVLIKKLFHSFYTPYGLTFVQVPVLMALRRNGKMRVSDLGESLEIGSSNITPLCKRLEKSNLVTRTRSDEDQRVVFVEITDYALDILDKIEEDFNARMPDSVRLNNNESVAIENGLEQLHLYLVNLYNKTLDDRIRFN